MKKAFTLIELLVVIAIIAILAAILFPVFAQAKEAAKKTVAISNSKEQSLGVIMYAGDVDDMLPQSEYGNSDQPGAKYPLIQWYAAVYPYIKNGQKTGKTGDQFFGRGGVFEDPGYPTGSTDYANNPQAGGQAFGVHRDLFPTNYGDPTTFTATPTVSATSIDAPADKVMLLAKGANSPTQGSYPWFITWEWFWTSGLHMSNGQPTTDNNDCLTNKNSGCYSAYFDTDGSTSDWRWENAAYPRYRHTQACPVGFMDGHSKAMKKGSIKFYQNIYVPSPQFPANQGWYPY